MSDILIENSDPSSSVVDQIIFDLFKTKNVQQVKDELTTLNQELKQVDTEFNDKLKSHYKDILDVTLKINSLYEDLKVVDDKFRDLCFDDSVYQIDRLPDFVPSEVNLMNETVTSAETNGLMETRSNVVNDPKIDTDLVLLLSQWVLAISNFVTRFANFESAEITTSTNTTVNYDNIKSSKLFTDLIASCETLEQKLTQRQISTAHQDLVDEKVSFLQNFIVESLEYHTIYFNLAEWVKIRQLFGRNSVLKWDPELTSRFTDLLYETLLKSYDLETLLSQQIQFKFKFKFDDPDILSFLQSDEFRESLILKVITNVENQAQKFLEQEAKHAESKSGEQKTGLDDSGGDREYNEREKDNDGNEGSSSDDTDTSEPNATISDGNSGEIDVENLIARSLLNSKGLVQPEETNIYETINPIISTLQNLVKLGCDRRKIAQVGDKLVRFLNGRLQEPSTPVESSETPSSDELVANILREYNLSNSIRLFRSQIETLSKLVDTSSV